MSSPPASATDKYLDVLRALGVTDAELRRLHGVAPDASVHAAVAGDLDAPTDDLLDALAATGRVIDLDEDVTPEDDDAIAALLGRLGYLVDVSTADGDLEVLAYDSVREAVHRVRCPPEREAVLDAVTEEVLAPAGVELRPLLDGRTLLVDVAALQRLQDRYGVRLAVFGTPLLDADVDGASRDGTHSPEGTSGGPSTRGRSPATSAPSPSPAAGSVPAASAGSAGPDAGETRGARTVEGAVAAAENPDAVADALASSGPRVHTAPGTADDVPDGDDETLGIGGGPRRTVSTSGIDDVFERLESDADDAADDSTMTSDRTTTTATSSDPLPRERSDGSTDGLAGGGPERTVSTTSADDILARATGEPDFERVAAEEDDPDPDAILADADDLPIPELESDDDGDESFEPDVVASESQSAVDEIAAELDAEGVGDKSVDDVRSAKGEEPSVDELVDEAESVDAADEPAGAGATETTWDEPDRLDSPIETATDRTRSDGGTAVAEPGHSAPRREGSTVGSDPVPAASTPEEPLVDETASIAGAGLGNDLDDEFEHESESASSESTPTDADRDRVGMLRRLSSVFGR